MRQLADKGSSGGGPVFEWPEWVTVRGARVSYGGQELGVAPFDAGDGKISLLVATPGGRHVFWAAKDLGTSRVEPPVLGSRGEVAASRHTMVFTDAEIEQCTRMRTPNLVHNLKTGVVHLAIRCCGKNRCSNPHGENTNDAGPNLRDNLRDCKVGFKSSRDGGQTWGETGRSCLDPIQGMATDRLSTIPAGTASCCSTRVSSAMVGIRNRRPTPITSKSYPKTMARRGHHHLETLRTFSNEHRHRERT